MESVKNEVKDCTVKLNNMLFKEINIIHLENHEEVSVHLGGDPHSVLQINDFLNRNNLKGNLHIKGYDRDGNIYDHNYQNPNELQLHLDPFYISLNFPKK